MTVDTLIVGAGTAGCVLAARLSADPARTVLVVEAGRDFPDRSPTPAAEYGKEFDWGLTATVTSDRSGVLPRGRGVGGCSRVNGCGAVRALPADYEAWASLGLPDWSWRQVLPAYCRTESDRNFPDSSYHGATGPVPITRPDGLTGPARGFLEAAQNHGHRFQEDMNAPGATGLGPYPHNRYEDGARASTARAYLGPVRGRENLTVAANTRADKIVLRHGRAIGIESAGEYIPAREVILAAGTPLGPALLLRSGIGPAEALRAAGIGSHVDLPGVGRKLYDQPGAAIHALPAERMAMPQSRLSELVGRLDSASAADQAFYLTLSSGQLPGRSDPSISVMVGDLRPAACGRIAVDGPDPARSPTIDLGFYRTPNDLARMRQAYRHAWSIATHPAFARHISRFEEVDDRLVGDDGLLDAALRTTTFSRLALTGGAAMGLDEDPYAVVDHNCRVYGVDRLRVVDLSITPVRLRSPTALDAIAIAEHAATRF